MKTLHQKQSTDRQQFDWGSIFWLHEPEMASDRRVSVARVTIEAGCFQDRHFHLGEEQLFYVIQGQGLFITDRGQETVSPGMVVYVPPYSDHEVQNTGNTPLVFDVIYVPIRLKQPDKPVVFSSAQSLQEVVSQEVLQNVCDQMTERLKLHLFITDPQGVCLTKPQPTTDWCRYCHVMPEEGAVAAKTAEANEITESAEATKVTEVTGAAFKLREPSFFHEPYQPCVAAQRCLEGHSFGEQERIWHCESGLKRLYMPIFMGDQLVGSIRSEGFLFNHEDVHMSPQRPSTLHGHQGGRGGRPPLEEPKARVKYSGAGRSSVPGEKVTLVTGQPLEKEETEAIHAVVNQIPKIIKSRVHVMVEHLETAANFLQILMERQVFDRELTEKENALVRQAQEKLKLMDALKKANEKLGYRTLFSEQPALPRQAPYPYQLEKKLAMAMEAGNEEAICREIAAAEQSKLSGEVVPEMIAVLLSRVLKPLEDEGALLALRQKYHGLLREAESAGAWQVLQQCCLECAAQLKHHRAYQAGELIESINRYLRHHFTKDLTLTTVAEQFYVSPNYLSHLFNEKNQVSFSEYIQRLRVKEAQEMLVNSRMKVRDIGKRVGFNNDSYFVSVFRKQTGTTPNEYRKHHGSTNTMVNGESQ